MLDSLSRMPFIDTAELALILGEPHATVHRALTALLAEGIVGRVSHGAAHLPSSQRYHLTAKGIGEEHDNRGLYRMRVTAHNSSGRPRETPACHAIGAVNSASYLAPPDPSWLRNSVMRLTCTSKPRSGIQASSHE